MLQKEGSVPGSATIQGGLTVNEIKLLAQQAAHIKSAGGVTELAQAAMRAANKLPGSLDELGQLASKGVKAVRHAGDDVASGLTRLRRGAAPPEYDVLADVRKANPKSAIKDISEHAQAGREANFFKIHGRAPTDEDMWQYTGVPSPYDNGVFGKVESTIAPPEPMQSFKKYMQSFAKKPDAVRPRGILERLQPYLPYLGGAAVGNSVGAGAMYAAAQRAKSDRK